MTRSRSDAALARERALTPGQREARALKGWATRRRTGNEPVFRYPEKRNIALTIEQDDWLRQIAYTDSISVPAVIRRLIDQERGNNGQ